jgi:hypothetical protein
MPVFVASQGKDEGARFSYRSCFSYNAISDTIWLIDSSYVGSAVVAQASCDNVCLGTPLKVVSGNR